MDKTRIGIRYCGGCNPHYERVELFDCVRSLVKERFLFLPHDEQGLDGLIAVNGCSRACVVRDLYEVPCYSIAEKGGLDGLMEWLIALERMKQGDSSRRGR